MIQKKVYRMKANEWLFLCKTGFVQFYWVFEMSWIFDDRIILVHQLEELVKEHKKTFASFISRSLDKNWVSSIKKYKNFKALAEEKKEFEVPKVLVGIKFYDASGFFFLL